MCWMTASWSIPDRPANSPPTNPAFALWPAPAPRNGRWDKNSPLRAVAGLAGAAIKHADLLFGNFLVKRQRFGLEVALGHMGGEEVSVGILAAHQRRPIALADGLLQMRRD